MTAVERCLFVLREAARKPRRSLVALMLHRDLVVFHVVRADSR
ncbi:MAG TPA: hypothetical protein VH143_21090 [Kofleriaceae bacterium]|jgi:hypothetical protein|nr:hypothetical protein [Kofleriaceae bacterium]